jgi:hypothetical protein
MRIQSLCANQYLVAFDKNVGDRGNKIIFLLLSKGKGMSSYITVTLSKVYLKERFCGSLYLFWTWYWSNSIHFEYMLDHKFKSQLGHGCVFLSFHHHRQ